MIQHAARFPGYPRGMSRRRDEAEALLFEFTQSDALRKHGRAVEEAMRAYARWYGVTDADEIDTWGIVGLRHDFDYEQNTTEETHLHVGGRILRERGYPEEIVEAICCHADYMRIPRDTPLKKAIYACDELVGFLGACVKVRPSKKPTRSRGARRGAAHPAARHRGAAAPTQRQRGRAAGGGELCPALRQPR